MNFDLLSNQTADAAESCSGINIFYFLSATYF